MKSFLLIGLGKFGFTLANELLKTGSQVMVVDKDEHKINQFAHLFTHALSADCMNEDNLQSFDIPSFDACIVAIGDDFQSSLQITSLLKDLGAQYVVSKATTDIQKKFLLKNGADEVVYPDKDCAEKLAVTINTDSIYDFFDLDSTHCIFEIEIPADWVGKTILSVNVRKKYKLNILMIKKQSEIISTVDADYLFEEHDHVVVFGEKNGMIKFDSTRN